MNIPLAKLKNETIEKLARELAEGVSTKNPVDIMGDANAERFIKAIDLIKGELDTIIIMLLGQTPKINKDEVTKIMQYIKKKVKTNIVFISSYTPITEQLEKEFIVYKFPEDLAKSLDCLR